MKKRWELRTRRIAAFLLAFGVFFTQADLSALTVQAASKTAAKSVTLNYSSYTLKKGKKVTLKAKVSPSKAKNKKISWSSSKKTVAPVSKKGVVKGLKKGKATITATVKGTKAKARCKITVGTPAAKVKVTSETSLILTVGQTSAVKAFVEPKKASNKKLTYKSSKEEVASVSTQGVITAKAEGTATITVKAADGSGKKASVSVTVKSASGTKVEVTSIKIEQANNLTVSWDPASPTKLDATVVPANAADKTVTWSSSNEGVAKIDRASGVITPVKAGTAVMTAAAGGKTAGITVIVPAVSLEKVSFDPDTVRLEEGEIKALTPVFTPAWAKGVELEYSSTNIRAAVVDEDGVVTAVAPGEATIKAVPKNGGGTGTCRVIVVRPVTGVAFEKDTYEFEAGIRVPLSVTVTPEDATDRSVVFSVDKEEIAVIDEASGYLETKQAGTVKVTAVTADGGLKATATVRVTAPRLSGIYLDDSLTALAPGETAQLTAAAIPQAAELSEVTWESLDPAVATVADGTVTAVAKGETTITASAGGTQASCTVVVGSIKRAGSFKELESALADENLYDGILLETQESGEFVIPSGTYSDTALIVDAKNATVTNEAVFGHIQLLAVSGDTWIEKATGNTIDVSADKAHIVVAESADTAIEIGQKASSVFIENNGTIEKVAVRSNGFLKLLGNNVNIIPVDVVGAGAKIETSIPVAVSTQQVIFLHLLPGAESATSVEIPDERVMPYITGVGIVPVTRRDTNTTTDVVAEYAPVTEIPGTTQSGAVAGIVKDMLEQPIESAVIYAIPYTLAFDGNQLQAAIEAAERQEMCYITTTDSDGTYETPRLSYGNYVMIVKADGKKSYFQTLTVTEAKINAESIMLVEDTDATSDIEGILKDAATGLPVAEGISLHIRQGANNVSGEIIQTVLTDEDGAYRFSGLPCGSYCIQIEDTREVEEPYVRITYNVVVLANTTVQSNMSVSKYVEGDQIRFVLTWAEEDTVNNSVPSDLDSHLVGPTLDKKDKFHVYFSDGTYYEQDKDGESIKYVDLDVDDIDYEGPETVTVYNKVDGLYHYYVYDFSDQGDEQNMRLATSKAVVKVYIGTRCVATYHVPYEMGTLWDVCTYDSATNIITPVNTVYYFEGSSETVGLTKEDAARKKLRKYMKELGDADFGEMANAQLKEKIGDIDVRLERTASLEGIKALLQELTDFVEAFRESTRIGELKSDKLHSAVISRAEPGEYFKSSIEVKYFSDSWAGEGLTVTVPKGASYEIKDSDNEEYSRMIVVTSSVTKAVETYYVTEEEYAPRWDISSVTANGKYAQYQVVNIDGKRELYVWGAEERLNSLEVQFDDEDITVSCELQPERDAAAVLTASVQEYSVTFDVYYTQSQNEDLKYDIYDFDLEEIDDSANGNMILQTSWSYRSGNIGILEIVGTKKNLGGDAAVRFTGLTIENTKIEAAESGLYNYRMTFVCEGQNYEILLNYKQTEASVCIPDYGEYQEDGETEWLDEIRLQDIDGETHVLIGAYSDEEAFDGWDTLQFSNSSYSFVYTVRTEGQKRYLDISDGENIIGTYPLVYTKYYSGYLVGTFTDEGNYIVDYDCNFDELIVYGENETLGHLVYVSYDEKVSAVYEPAAGENGAVGSLTVTFGAYKKKTYDVYYKQSPRRVSIESVESDENLIEADGWEYKEDEEENEIRVFELRGYQPQLDETATFILCDLEGEILDPALYTCELVAVSGKAAYNYELHVEIKGMEQIVYLNYTQDSEMAVNGAGDDI